MAGKTCNYAGQKPATLTMNYALITRVRRYITVSGEGGHFRPFPDALDLRHTVDEDVRVTENSTSHLALSLPRY